MPTTDQRADTAEQAAFRAEARAWLEAHADPKGDGDPWEVSGFPDEEQAHAYFERGRAWQRTLADHGWAGLTWPVEYGGRGGPAWLRSAGRSSASGDALHAPTAHGEGGDRRRKVTSPAPRR